MTLQSETSYRSAPPGALLFVLGFAGLSGAAGVALAAVAAHKIESPALATAATVLMIHAGASVGLASVSVHTTQSLRWLIIAGVMLAAAALFSGAVGYHTLTGSHLFPSAAPIGGSTLIATWLAVAALAFIEWRSAR